MTENVRPSVSHRLGLHAGGVIRVAFGSAIAMIALAVALAGCARTPTGPSVMVLAGSGKSLEEFQRDDAACRASAAQELERTKHGDVPAQRRFDITYMQCMYAKGHQIPVPGGRPNYTSSGSPRAPSGAPVGAAQAECERSGGVWRPGINACERPATPPVR
jgi:hypothetical protein